MRIFKTILAAAMAAAVLSASPVLADDKMEMKPAMVMAGDLHISAPWTRAMLSGQKVGGGFLIVENKGGQDDRLVSVTTPRTDNTEIHEMAVVDDVMKMRALPDGLVIPAGETVELKPGGYHLMFMAVPEPFKEGEMVPVVLNFEKAGNVELVMPVKPAGTKAMDHGKHHHGKKTN